MDRGKKFKRGERCKGQRGRYRNGKIRQRCSLKEEERRTKRAKEQLIKNEKKK